MGANTPDIELIHKEENNYGYLDMHQSVGVFQLSAHIRADTTSSKIVNSYLSRNVNGEIRGNR